MSARGLEAVDLTVTLDSFALREASLAVEPGEALVLLGPNGAGKSVCLEAIAGFHRLSGGRVHIGSRDVTGLPPEQRHVAFVVQNFGLFPHLSVLENVALGRRGRGNHADIGAMLVRLGIARLAAERPTHLSPGEKQRVALARALVSRPDLFLFDEPFAALDAATTVALRDDLARFLRETALPAVFVTHDHAEARALADRVAIIDAGVIRQHGGADEVFDHPASIAIARFLGFENLLEGRIISIERDRVRVSVRQGVIEGARPDVTMMVPGRSVTLCLRAENVHLFPSQSSLRPNVIAAHVVNVRPSGPFWTVALDCGFPLIAYALPQTMQACALAPGARVDAEINPASVHVVVQSPSDRITSGT